MARRCRNAFVAMHFAHAGHTGSFVQCGTERYYVAMHQSAQTDVSRRTTAMLFSGIIAALIARLQAHRAYKQRLRELESLDDRELKELGLTRSTLEAAARRA